MLFHFLIAASEKGISPSSIIPEEKKNIKEIMLEYAVLPEKLDLDEYVEYDPKIESFTEQEFTARTNSSIFISMPYSTKTRSPISARTTSLSPRSMNDQPEDNQQDEEMEEDVVETPREARSKQLSKLLKVCSDGLEKKGIKVQHLQSYLRNSQGFPR